MREIKIFILTIILNLVINVIYTGTNIITISNIEMKMFLVVQLISSVYLGLALIIMNRITKCLKFIFKISRDNFLNNVISSFTSYLTLLFIMNYFKQNLKLVIQNPLSISFLFVLVLFLLVKKKTNYTW